MGSQVQQSDSSHVTRMFPVQKPLLDIKCIAALLVLMRVIVHSVLFLSCLKMLFDHGEHVMRTCKTWYNAECTDLDPDVYPDLDVTDWVCSQCQ